MKKLLSLSLAIALAMNGSVAHAFEFEHEPQPGFTFMGLLGMNVSKLQNHAYGGKVGGTAGGRVDFMLPKAHGTYLTAGVDWTMKGGRTSGSDVLGDREVSATSKYNLHYFEVPIRVGFRYNLSENLGLYGEFGPYFAVGVGGKHRLNISEDGEAANKMEDERTFKAFKNYGYPAMTFQRWDAGLGFRVGAEYNEHYNLLIGCDWGLADIYRDSLRDAYFDKLGTRLPKVKNFNFSITVGYRL